MLGQRGVHFLLTVSDDALLRFSARRQERGIVESAFENIIVLGRVNLEAADYMVELMYPKAQRRDGSQPLHISTVLLWLFGGGVPREIKRNALACLEEPLRPKFESADRIWDVLFRRRIDEMQSWILRTGREDQATYDFLACLAETRALLDDENPRTMEAGRAIAGLWDKYLAQLYTWEKDANAGDDRLHALSCGRAVIDILLGVSALAYVLTDSRRHPYGQHLQDIDRVLEWTSSNLQFARKTMSTYLRKIDLLPKPER